MSLRSSGPSTGVRHIHAVAAPHCFPAGTAIPRTALINVTARVELSMADKRSEGYFGVLLGGLVAVAAVAFLLSGGEWGGKKKINSDEDLPPVATTSKAK
jgi:hypothetical protein